MRWVAPPEKDQGTETLESRLWEAADQLRANSGLSAAQYSQPVLGLIFLRFAAARFDARRKVLEGQAKGSRRGSRIDDASAYHAEGVLYLEPAARFEHLLGLPEGAAVGEAVNAAMRAIERDNPQLAGALPKTYEIFTSTLLKELLKKVSEIPGALDYDAFGRIYEYFLGEFARTEGQKGGEFYTPSSIVRLLVEVIEPYHGRILDPACGSGGMFVQSARFIAEHKKNPSSELSIHGQEKTSETVKLCRMNLAVHGLEGDIRQANSYYEDLHDSVGRFDFVLANPPFNVSSIDTDRLAGAVGEGRRFPFGLPSADNGNYVWIQLFLSALNTSGRAGFVIANTAADAEAELRRKLIESKAVDVVVSVGPNMFYTVILPCALWFLDRGKRGSSREDKILFVDARQIYRQVDRVHREWTQAQVNFITNVVRLYRGEHVTALGETESDILIRQLFGKSPEYKDVPGLCSVQSVAEIQQKDWSLNPGLYVGRTTGEEVEEADWEQKVATLCDDFQRLTSEARALEDQILANTALVLRTGVDEIQ
jgi:type I restriction enzyme M protein